MVVAAETGSGKTHCYLVPLIDRLFIERTEETSTPSILLILCPNVLLCDQVVRMAKALTGDDGKPLISVASVGGRQVPLIQPFPPLSVAVVRFYFSLFRW